MLLLKLTVKNAFRHKLRTILTMLGVTVAILAFGLLRTVIDAWYAGVDASSASRLVTRNAISLIFSLPVSYKEKIRQVDGVKIVSYGNWFGGIYIDEKNFFANFAVEPKSYLELYPEYVIEPEQAASFLRDRRGFAAGRKTVEKFGWQTGDAVTLKGTIFPGEWDFILRAIYRSRDSKTDETQFFFHWDYLNETMKKTIPGRADQVGFYIIGISDPDRAADMSIAIDKTFKNSLAETLTETEKAFQLGFVAMSDAIIMAVQLVSFVVIIIILAVAANTMAMTARERIGEYAIFKTLGFSGWHIALMIFGESITIAMAGCVLGVLLTFPAAKVFMSIMGTFLPVFNVAPETIYMDAAVSFAVGFLAAIIPAYRAIKIRIADGLRRIG
ncbi:MAG TPA: FtsX-like permease family protein [Thermodesulfovibrionia bacterium]|nr:FtsX-like permease family protein [Thermodesulfovibrionia bacterium]